MDTLTIKADGLSRLDANLRAMGTDVAVKWTNGGLRAGSRRIQLGAKGSVAVKSGALRDSIRIVRGKKSRGDNLREYFVVAGNREKKGGAFYAHMVERGTKPHVIKGRMRFGGNYASVVQHPGAKPSHFMERAAKNAAQAAIEAFGAYIRTKLAKAGMLNPAAETE